MPRKLNPLDLLRPPIDFIKLLTDDVAEELYRRTPCFYCKDKIYDPNFLNIKHLCKQLYEKHQDLHGDEVFESDYKKYNQYLKDREFIKK